MKNEPSFIPLRMHSDYSIVDGLHQPKALVQAAHALSYPAAALTDVLNISGWLQFSSAAYSQGLKPIAGVDFCIHSASNIQGRVTLLARSEKGYQALLVLLTQVCTMTLQKHAFKEKSLSWEQLTPYRKDLFFLSGGDDGLITYLLRAQPNPDHRRIISTLLNDWKGSLFLEIQRTGSSWESVVNAQLLELSRCSGVAVVATHPIYFLSESEFAPHQVRVAIQKGLQVSDKGMQPLHYSQENYLQSQAAMAQRFHDLPHALANSVEIAKRCNIFPKQYATALPKLETGEMSNEVYLETLAQRGLKKRLDQCSSLTEEVGQHYHQRLKYELDVIASMGFASYFLVVQEFIHWSKEQNIAVGPGRGSGAGSLVAYALGITEIDPIRFQLLFERFLNSARISLPDFDIDFCPRKRDRVIQHVMQLYGKASVAQIATFGTMMARGVIRDVGRALGHPYGFIDKIAKLVPFELGMTLEKALESSPPLKTLYKEDEEVSALFDVARVLEGVIRNVGKHAGGIVIAPQPLSHYTALTLDAEEKNFLTQCDKDDLERIGLVKFDFLGLKTLTILEEAVHSIHLEQKKKNQPLLVLEKIPLDDRKVFEFLCSGQTAAIFQLESRGMRQLVLKLMPDSFEEIIALVALYRPGPLQSGMVDNFINRKHGREVCAYPDPDYQHERLKPILQETYGIILYQEQAMQIAQVLAGYSLSEADILRRVIGKKKTSEMLQQRQRFAQGAKMQGISQELAERIFDLVEKFSGYAFNKSHSAAYALITYQTLYLKTHFPEHFIAAVLSSDLDHTDKLSEMLDEARRMGIKLCSPNINRSQFSFTVSSPMTIEFGLGAIKGLGHRSVEAILLEREKLGPFKSFEEFLRRILSQDLGRAGVEKLIMAGAFDVLDPNRKKLSDQLPGLLTWLETSTRSNAAGQQGLFSANDEGDKSAESERAGDSEKSQWSLFQRLQKEYQVLGYYFSGNPLKIFEKEFKFHQIKTELDLDKESPFNGRNPTIKIALVVQKVRFKRTKRGDSFAIISGISSQETIQIIAPFSVLEPAKSFCQPESIIIVEVSIKREPGAESARFFAQSIQDWNQLRVKLIGGLNFEFLSENEGEDFQNFCSELLEFKQRLLNNFRRGKISCSVTMAYPHGKVVWNLPEKFNLQLDLMQLKALQHQTPYLSKIELRYPEGWVLFE